MPLIYHLTDARSWEKALDAGIYETESLLNEGFIHCSTQAQVLESAQLHFQEADEIIVLAIVDRRVRDLLKWEPGREGQLFPHVYGAISLDAIETTYLLVKGKGNDWEWVR